MNPLTIPCFIENNDDYSSDFPITVDFSTAPAFMKVSFYDLFRKAQEHSIPFYSITIVEVERKMGKREWKTIYSLYDTSHLFNNFDINQPQPLDPRTQLPIQKTGVFVIKCFEFDKDHICRKIDLTIEKTSLFPLDRYVDPKVGKRFQNILLDSINPNVLEYGNKKDQMQVRISQLFIAKLISTSPSTPQKKIFQALEEDERRKEIFRWAWSSAQGSNQGVLYLIKECLSRQKLFNDPEKLANQYLTVFHPIPPGLEKFSEKEKDAQEEIKSFFCQFPTSEPKKN